MSEVQVECPKCKHRFDLSESIAAPLVSKVKEDYEKRLIKEKAEVGRASAEAFRDSFEQANKAVLSKMETQRVALEQLQKDLSDKEEKLLVAQAAQAQTLQQSRELAEARRDLTLNVEKGIQAGLSAEREKGRQDATSTLELKLLEKDETLAALQKQIGSLKQRAEQGSQQLQGEVQELQLESALRATFPFDSVDPVGKGEFGGDILQTVSDGTGSKGVIIWESKRTKSWSDGWLSKLRDDQRAAKAEIAVLVTTAMPKAVELFELREGVWVVTPKAAVPVAMLLRHALIETAAARQTTVGQASKMEMLYEYLIGPRFKQRVQAIVEGFTSMQEDLDRERKVIRKQWAKREEQIERVTQATIGMYGDLQGIAGKALGEVEALRLPSPEEPL